MLTSDWQMREYEMRLFLTTLLLGLIIGLPCRAEQTITFKTANSADEESIKKLQIFLSTLYGWAYNNAGMKSELLEIEITNAPYKPLPQRWEKDQDGGSSLFAYWTYHIWYDDIHMDCYDIGLPTVTTYVCPFKQKVDLSTIYAEAQASK